jgi:hypothetical protein
MIAVAEGTAVVDLEAMIPVAEGMAVVDLETKVLVWGVQMM